MRIAGIPADDGSGFHFTAWNAEQVAGEVTTVTAPSMTNDGNDVNIAAEGANGGLDFYWAVNGTATWNPEQVAPPGTVG